MHDAPSALPALLALVAVVALIPVALWLLKRLQRGAPGTGRVVTLVGGLALGPRERITVVEAGGRRWMLGVTGQSISLLAELERGDDAGAATSADGIASAAGFARLLERFRRDA